MFQVVQQNQFSMLLAFKDVNRTNEDNGKP